MIFWISAPFFTKVVFTFTDNSLNYIEARGNVRDVFSRKRVDTARVYLDYDIYEADKLFLGRKKDVAWILSEEGLHTNLFAWENPYLNSNDKET